MDVDNLVRVPTWDHPDTLTAIEDRVDSAVSSANTFLDFLLAPVRAALRLVLHIVFAFADLTIGWVYGVLHWTFDRLAGLADQARTALGWVLRTAIDYAARIATDALYAAGAVGETLRRLVQTAVDAVYGVVRGWVDDAVHYASRVADGARALIVEAVQAVYGIVRGWVDDAIHYASRVADGARALIVETAEQTFGRARRAVDDLAGVVRGWVAGAVDTARGLVAGAVDAARAALDLIVRTLVAPLAGAVETFFDGPWRWAFGLLKVVETSAEWLLWVGSRVVPDVTALWRIGKEVLDDDHESIAGQAAALARTVND